MTFYADGNKEQTLMVHVDGVKRNASRFADDFNSSAWGFLLGDWHDLGKFTEAFQSYLLEGGPRVEHASVGGRYATEQFNDPLRKLALQFSITCHHTGLQNGEALQRRLKNAGQLLRDAIINVPDELRTRELPDWPVWLRPPSSEKEIGEWKKSLEFWIRMLHSCLVDADWLDAEKRNQDTPKRPGFQPIIKLTHRSMQKSLGRKT